MAFGPPLTQEQLAQYNQDRRPALYASMTVLLLVNNVVAFGRVFSHWRAHYRHSFSFKRVFAEDYFSIVAAICVNVVCANLIAATYFGLGIHSWRINAEDPHYPRNLSQAFMHVWITMLMTGPTFTAIKVTLLFFYRRIFLISQRWLLIAWWINMVYVILWLFGSTGFYLFQCWPVQWYFMQYYQKYDREPPYPISGNCNATTTIHVAIPLIFGIFSDVMILTLPLATISSLRMSARAKCGLGLVFSVGILACLLDIVRIVELTVDTDDKVDPSYGVVVFLALSAATEVAAILCAALPIVGPQVLREYKSHNRTPNYNHSSTITGPSSRGRLSKGFEQLSSSRSGSNRKEDTVALTQMDPSSEYSHSKPADGVIWVESEVEVTVRDNHEGVRLPNGIPGI